MKTSQMCGLLLLAVVGRFSSPCLAQNLVVSYHQVAHSLVLVVVDGPKERLLGVGVVVDSSSRGSVVLTAAHVLRSPAGQQSHTHASVFHVSILQPFAEHPLASDISVSASDIDETLDLALIRLDAPNLPVACIADSVYPSGDRIGLAAFSIRKFTDSLKLSDIQMLLAQGKTYQTVREGLLGQVTRDDIEYFAPEEEGFSGGPIFDESSGLIFAIVQKGIQIGYKISTATYVSVAGSAFTDFVSNRDKDVEFVDSSWNKYGSSQRPSRPNLERDGRLVFLSSSSDRGHFDRTTISIADSLLQSQLTQALGLTDLYSVDDRQLQVSLIGIDDLRDRAKVRYAFFTSLCDDHRATGVIEARRNISGDNNSPLISYNISYSSCAGDIYHSVEVGPINFGMSADPAKKDAQVAGIRDEISKQIASNTPVSARGNFRTYGILIGDGEHTAYFDLSKNVDGRPIIRITSPAGTAAIAGMVDGTEVYKFDGRSGDDLAKMDRTALSLLAKQSQEDGGSVEINQMTIRSINICGYLSLENIGVRENRIALGLP